MSFTRVIYGRPPKGPHKIASGPGNAREGDIPYWAEWSDGSKYSVHWLDDKTYVRSFSGPLFPEAAEGPVVEWVTAH